MKSYYDYIIVGTGPSGLALAQCLCHTHNSILLLDSVDAIGGCHRVLRVPYQEKYQLFTEHGPRIYPSNYKNFQMLLTKMGYSFESLFTPYRYSILVEIARQVWRNLSINEMMHLGLSFLLFLSDDQFGKQTTVLQFVQKHHFQPQAIQMLDRACRMVDGSGIDRYSLNRLFQIVNQSFFYQVYQPVQANDKGLFHKWHAYFEQHDNMDFLLEHDVLHLSYNRQINSIHSVWAVDKKNHNTIEIKCRNVILAIPPPSIARVLSTCHEHIKNSFLPYDRLLHLAQTTEYIPYICITYHWNTVQKITSTHGFPVGEWGIIFIVLSDYLQEEFSKTLISTCVSYTDRKSLHTGKTANQSSAEEVMEETFRQLQQVLPSLETPTVSLLSPQCFYDTKTQTWKQKDISYFASIHEQPLPNHGKVKNLYNVGTHNGNSDYNATTMETAVINSIVLASQLDSSVSTQFPLQKITTLRFAFLMFVCVLFVLLLLIAIIILFKKKNKK